MGTARRTTTWRGARTAIAVTALAAGTVVVAPPASACACGGMVDNPAYETAVTAETAILQWDGETETMLLALDALSNAPEVGLILPTPAPAEVALADPEVFRELDEITAPRAVVSATRWWPELTFGTLGAEDGAAGSAPDVSVLAEVRLGPLDVTTLRARDTTALQGWLADKGFELSPSIERALAPYVKDEWSFVAARLAPEAATSFDGTLQPLRVTFPSDEIVYPMRMSSVAESTQNTRTYVLGDHRVDRQDATAEASAPDVRFAGRVEPATVDSPELAALLRQGDYVTSHEQVFTEPGTEILSDFAFVQASSDTPVVQSYAVVADKRIGPFFAGPVLVFGAFLALAVLVVWRSRRRRAPARAPTASPHPARA
ncbi:DUF2330 domain-containing protein [Cellulosimicrobium terreum]|nr:DUF2330 domain-containing protein [Cellulosimicrobium terreum]